MSAPLSPEPSRRLVLRATLKSMVLLAALAMLYVFGRALFGHLDDLPDFAVQRVDLRQFPPGEPAIVDWEGRQVIVLRLTPAQRREAASEREWLVALANGTGMGCPLEWVTGDGHQGRFVDRCDGSQYDAGGSVLPEQPASRDLTIPPYRIDYGPILLLGAS